MIYSIPANENSYSIKLKTQGKDVGHFTDAMDNIEKVWKEAFPSQPFIYHFYDEAIADFYSKEQKTSQLVYLAMAIGVFISCIGLVCTGCTYCRKSEKRNRHQKSIRCQCSHHCYDAVKRFYEAGTDCYY